MISPFSKYCDTKQNEGKIKQLRLTYSAEICNSQLDTAVEIAEPAEFLFFENWIADWSNEDAEIAEFKLFEDYDENGLIAETGISVKVKDDISPSAFKKWWFRIQKRNLAAEIINFNDVVRLLNPLKISYEYIQPSDFGMPAYYLFKLNPTRLVDYSSSLLSVPAILSAVPECHEILDAIDSSDSSCEIINLRTIVSCQI